MLLLIKHTGTAKPSGSSTGVNGVILAEAPTGWAPLNRPPSEEVAMDSAETEGILITFFSLHRFLLRIINRIIFKSYWQLCFLYTCILTIFFSNCNSLCCIFQKHNRKISWKGSDHFVSAHHFFVLRFFFLRLSLFVTSIFVK